MVRVLGPVKEDQENARVSQPADEVIEKLLGGLVDPVKVLDGEDEGFLLALPDEEIPDGLEDPLPLLLGFELR